MEGGVRRYVLGRQPGVLGWEKVREALGNRKASRGRRGKEVLRREVGRLGREGECQEGRRAAVFERGWGAERDQAESPGDWLGFKAGD